MRRRHMLKRHKKVFIAWRATALENFDVQPPGGRLQAKTQRSGRRFAGGSERAHHPEQHIRGLRGQMQAPQRFTPDMRLPEKQGATAPVAQDLLGCP